jgi:hypothetical protein
MDSGNFVCKRQAARLYLYEKIVVVGVLYQHPSAHDPTAYTGKNSVLSTPPPETSTTIPGIWNNWHDHGEIQYTSPFP